MPQQLFNFPGYYDREIDLTARTTGPVGIPAGLVGASLKGPAFIPYTLGSFNDFVTKFGGYDPKLPVPYAADKFLQNRNALTFVRVLGAGSNTTAADIDATRTAGIVVNAGFKISGAVGTNTGNRGVGAVQFLVARHELQSDQAIGYPMFTSNDSYADAADGTGFVNLVRGVLFVASGSRVMIMSASNEVFSPLVDDTAVYSVPSNSDEPYVKLVISTSLGTAFGTADGYPGIRILSASFNPTSDLYFGKLLNTDPAKFEEQQHFLYADFAVDDEVATVVQNSVSGVLVASGSANTSATSGLSSTPFLELFGRFDTRFKSPKTTSFISQPYGSTEYDLFHIEAIDDGAYSNDKIKISIQNILASTNPTYQYGTFSLAVRRFSDNDYNLEVIEQYNDLTLDPDSDKYIAKVIGDSKAFYNFDVEDPNDRRIERSGKYPNKSNYIRVVMNVQVDEKKVPATALPFGFRGPQLLNTNPLLTDVSSSVAGDLRLAGSGSSTTFGLEGAIIPPVPFRYKATRGAVSGSGLVTLAGAQEISDARLYWGVKFERNNNNVLNTNINGELNNIVPSFTKFAGIEKLDVLVTGSSSDDLNDNKFTLARVALGVTSFNQLTSSVQTQMKNAVYVRNGAVNPTTYTVTGSCVSGNQLTFASLVHSGTQPLTFNRFNQFAKFTAFLYGGFDGVNVLDKNAVAFNDQSTSTEVGVSGYGGANSNYDSPGFNFNQNGSGIANNQINSYRVATDIVTNPIASNINILAVPGQREPYVADYAADAAANYGLALYLMDIPNYNSSGIRIFDSTTTGTGSYINVQNTATSFDTRALNNTFAAAYFPDVVMPDPASGKRITVPASVASLAAIGYNDKVAYPWFAPAGFNRAALNFVSLTRTRVNQSEREKLYQVRVNPIVKFPNEGYVIFAQKTLDGDQTSLDSINVQRMVMDVERQVIDIGNRLIWQQLTPALYQEFVARVTPVLSLVQSRGGLRQYKIVCDATNNTDLDRENNRMNAKIYLLPVKAVEFIAVDFIITRAGVQFG
jgi:hypothetical protein